jgi:hypothetical protein
MGALLWILEDDEGSLSQDGAAVSSSGELESERMLSTI